MLRSLAIAAVIAALPLARAGAQSSGRPVGELAPVTVTAKSERGVLGRAATIEADRNQLTAMSRENRRLGAVLDRQEKEIAKLEVHLAEAKAVHERKLAEVTATEQQVAELRKRRQALEAAVNSAP